MSSSEASAPRHTTRLPRAGRKCRRLVEQRTYLVRRVEFRRERESSIEELTVALEMSFSLRSLPNDLRLLLAKPLPGLAAQLRMAPDPRTWPDEGAALRPAAALLLI